jgi:hypothetical protein
LQYEIIDFFMSTIHVSSSGICLNVSLYKASFHLVAIRNW